MGQRELRLTAGRDDDGRRVDKIVRRLLPSLSLAAIYRLFRTGDVRINGKKVDANERIRSGDELLIRSLPEDLALKTAMPPTDPASPATPPLAPLLRTENLVFFNKPKGMLVHGPDSLEDRVRAWIEAEAPASLSFAPGPLHRLDRNTSGIVAFPMSALGAREFSRALREHLLVKEYLAVLSGALRSPERWLDPLERLGDSRTTVRSDGARLAETFVAPAYEGAGATLCALRITTGITHQIRAQAAIHGHPLSGDAKYLGQGEPAHGRGAGKYSVWDETYVLHAFRLSIPAGLLPEGALSVVAPPDPGQRSRIAELAGPGSLAAVDALLAGQSV